MDLPTLRKTTAEIAALALFELFPDVELREGGLTATGFYYDLYFPHPITPETLPCLEERMRGIVKAGREIRTVEMVGVSARELLKKVGHLYQSEQLEGEGLFELIQIGEFYALSEGPHLSSTREVAAFKLERMEPLGRGEVRLEGTAHISKEKLKDFLKRLAAHKGRKVEERGAQEGYWVWVEGKRVWLAKGLELKRRWVEWVKEKIAPEAQWVEGGEHARVAETPPFQRRRPLSFIERFFEEEGEEVVVNFFFDPRERDRPLISLLHLIEKTLTILGFRYQLTPLGPRGEKKSLKFKEEDLLKGIHSVEFWVEDEIERPWKLFSLMKGGKGEVSFSFSADRSIDLLIELERIQNWGNT